MATQEISEHFTLGGLLRFTAPTAVMMVFTSIYGVVDGLFVSNFVGIDEFAALNLIYPFLMLLGALGFMLGTGGTALVAKTMGEGDTDRARGLFTFLIIATLVLGVLCTAIGLLCVNPVARMLGAEGSLLDSAVLYGSILSLSLPFLMLQEAFQSFLAAAGKPKVGLAIIVVAGVANIVLDALFIVGFGWGLAGAAIATAISEVLGGGIPLGYFALRNSSTLRFTCPVVDMRAFGKACVNGSSELVSNLAMSLVSMLYTYQLMRYIGSDGVAAYGVIQYVAWIFASLYMGFCMGSAPLVSFQYGARNQVELKNLFRKCLSVIAGAGVVLTVVALVAARPLALMFVGSDAEVVSLTMEALSIYSYVFLLMGFNIFGSAFFTALNNGLVSALISFLRTLVFEVAAIMVLPMFLGIHGIWLAVIVAEAVALILTASFLVGLRKRYGYA